MIEEKTGKVIKGLGGLYTTRVTKNGEKEYLFCRAKGTLHREDEKVLIGDDVRITVDTETQGGVIISEILPRRNSLIRPPMANLDYIFITFAAQKPVPVLETVDKLTAIATHNGITPVIVITKSDLNPEAAQTYRTIYNLAGIPTFVTSSEQGDGISELSEYIRTNVSHGRTAAFAGASGVGKSTLMNALFPGLALATAEISRKIERGRHTTRHVELFELEGGDDTGFLADTPGFSLIDFARFDFMSLEELLPAFPDVLVHSGRCRYADCSHIGEGADECAVHAAARSGALAQSRLDSYRAIYKVLKEKKKYD